ncbi:MAG TPA: MFS transporter [Casimicrobiaceae bacterium]|nr:MFS transporter [Casimicrobiaceae bacterium]
MPWTLVLGLGVGQIISWGALIYSIAVLGSPMAKDLGVSSTVVFGAFSASLVVSGLAGPRVGKLIDRRGGRSVLAWGSVGAAASLAALAWAPNVTTFFLAWIFAGMARAMTLYEAAFATLSQHTDKSFRNSVTAITLLGGLAGTVFFPLSLFGLEHIGWRGTLACFAAAQVLLCLPLHVLCIPAAAARRSIGEPASTAAASATARPAPAASFAALSASFALSAFITSAIAVHVINLLQARGLGIASAVFVASLIGPMQLTGRLLEFALGRRFSSVLIGASTLVLLVLSLAILAFVDAQLSTALLFALTYGCANGIQTIVRGTVPAELFGRQGYGHTVGRLAAPSFIARAVAPLALTLTASPQLGMNFSVPLLIGIAALALISYVVATRHALKLA